MEWRHHDRSLLREGTSEMKTRKKYCYHVLSTLLAVFLYTRSMQSFRIRPIASLQWNQYQDFATEKKANLYIVCSDRDDDQESKFFKKGYISLVSILDEFLNPR